jgi:retron-type reverse transcriptase
MRDTEPGETLSTELNLLSEIAARDSKVKFTSLAQLMTKEFLKECYRGLNHHAAAGTDQVRYTLYGENLDQNIADLLKRLQEKRYRACDIRRVWIPKPDGRQRPLGIPVLEDRIVQRGVTRILSAIYEQDFLDVSYGFRAGKSGHDALKALELSIMQSGVNYLIDVDIKGYFDHVAHADAQRADCGLHDPAADREMAEGWRMRGRGKDTQ